MIPKKITVVTTTFNSFDEIAGYFEAFSSLDRRMFNWVVVDGGSTDGTREYLEERASSFDYFHSQADAGFFFGLNSALSRVVTPYYMVFGADDRPSRGIFECIAPLLDSQPALVLGAVRLAPEGKIKSPGMRAMHHIGWAQVISHHSVGTVIRMDTHQKYGMYDVRFPMLADGLHLKRILRSSDPVVVTKDVFGDFKLGGFSSRTKYRGAVETFLIQVTEGSNALFQLILMNLRILKAILSSKVS